MQTPKLRKRISGKMGIKEKANGGKEECIYMEGGKGKEIGEGQQGRGRKGRERGEQNANQGHIDKGRYITGFVCPPKITTTIL